MSKLTVPADVIGTSIPDLLEGASALYGTLIGIEILGSIIDTRTGDDTIAGTANYGSPEIGLSNSGTIIAGRENDTITGTANYGRPGIGISNSGTIIAGTGNDTITGTGTGTPVYRGQLPGLGILNSGTIIAGTGNDTITGIGTGGGARGISNSGWISGEADNDTIAGIAKGGGAGGEATGISNSWRYRWRDRNRLDQLALALANSQSMAEVADGTWHLQHGLDGWEEGNDLIIGTGTGNRGGVYIGPGTAKGGNGIGISNSSTINAGTGDDLLTGIGKGGLGSLSEGGNAVGISNSSYMSGDSGNDTITGIGLGGRGDSAPDGRGVGIFNTGRLDAGNDKDQILGYGTTVGIEGNGVQSIGIDGGNDNDYFKARKVNGFDPQNNLIESANQDGAIANIFISAGNGNDIFDVGFGSAKLDGGEGYDTLILPTLGSGTYTIGSQNAGLFEITNTASLNVLSVSNIEHIISDGVTLV
jgi:hypothetical protein